MKVHLICNKCVLFSLPSNFQLSEKEAAIIIHKIQKDNTLPLWKGFYLEVFVGTHSSLYLAHPKEELKICIAPYARPFFEEYFSE